MICKIIMKVRTKLLLNINFLRHIDNIKKPGKFGSLGLCVHHIHQAL